jgi:DNA-binding transcriptional LysR family regulator
MCLFVFSIETLGQNFHMSNILNMRKPYQTGIVTMSDLPELRHLRCFVVVAETLHFGRAAEQLGIAQPPLSQQIQRLEARVGYPLFERQNAGRRRVMLTAEGEALLGHAKSALTSVAFGVDAARRVGVGDEGQLTIGFVASVATTVLAPLLRTYRARHPGIALRLHEMTTSAQADALAKGVIDVGIAREVETTEAVSVVHLTDEALVAVLPIGHALASQARIQAKHLRLEQFILVPRSAGAAFHDCLLSVCRRAKFEPNITQEAREWTTILALVAGNMGITIAPASAAAAVNSEVISRPFTDPLAKTSISIWSLRTRSSPALNGFHDLARKFVIHRRAKG